MDNIKNTDIILMFLNNIKKTLIILMPLNDISVFD